MTVSLRFLILVVAALSTACASAQAPSRTDAPYLLVLGTAQDGGLPQIGCAQECCLRARRDPDARRLVTSLLLVDPRDGRRWLFDATPDLPKQVERARGHGGPAEDAPGRPPLFDGIFLTHAHLGHYAGLLHLGREAYGSQPTNLFGTSHMLNYLKSNGPWSLLFEGEHLSGRQLDPGGSVKLADDITVTAWQVPHRDEFTDTVAFVIRGPNKTALYLPDIDKWEQWDRDLEDALREVDLAFLDGSFFGPGELPGRDMSSVPHPFIVESLARLSALPDADRTKVHFTHLNHSNPAANSQSEAASQIHAAGVHVLSDLDLFEL